MKKLANAKSFTKRPGQKAFVSLHPHSLKYIEKGHPWIIKDSYTDQFPAKQSLLYVRQRHHIYTLIHDPKHKSIKARLWGQSLVEQESFDLEAQDRIARAFARRQHIKDRENVYLLFGEADFTPGLFILWLKEGILIQSYCSFWKKKQKILIPYLRELLQPQGLKWILWQDRDYERSHNLKPLWGKAPQELFLKEYDLTYKLLLNEHYDIGLYTDMAAIRSLHRQTFQGCRVLNLYAYTGAWSLYALSQGARHITNVDLSMKYLEWLSDNMALNNYTQYQNLCGDTLSLLKKLQKEKEKFDYIICDPPSFSSDGQKTMNALKSYESIIPTCAPLMPKNSKLLCFLNTHKVTENKFRQTMERLAKKNGLKVVKRFSLTEDCPTLKGFPEGDYLKGSLLQK